MLIGLVLLGIMLTRCLSGIQGNMGLNQGEDVQQLSEKATVQQPKSMTAYVVRTTGRKGTKLKDELLVLQKMNRLTSLVETVNAKYNDAPEQKSSNSLEGTILPGSSDQSINATSTHGLRRNENKEINSVNEEVGEKTTNALTKSGTEKSTTSGKRLKADLSNRHFKQRRQFLRTPPIDGERPKRGARRRRESDPKPVLAEGISFPGASAGKGEFNFRVQFCPFTKLCKGPEPESFTDDRPDVTPCCMPCSCETSCLNKGTCCPDVEPQLPSTDSTTGLSQCMLPVYPRGQQGTALRGYDVVVDCPSSYQTESVKRMCQGETPESLSELVFVTDRSTNRIYANHYCAQCHGVSDIVFWGIKETICNNIDFHFYTPFLHMVGTSEDLIKTVIGLPCSIEFKPPENQTVSTELCYMLDNARTTCNETGQWDVYNEQIESSCHAHETPYIHQSYDETERRVTSQYYGNIFCYLCNVPTEKAAMANDTCFSQQDNHEIMGFQESSAILDLDPLLQRTEFDTSKEQEQANDSNSCFHVNKQVRFI